MKYILLLYHAPGAWPAEDHRAAIKESVQLCHELHAQGKYLAAAPLQPADTATCVRVRDGRPIVTDGPFADTKEHLGGFFLIDAEDLDEAVAIAARVPGARRGTAEIRPLIELDDLPQRG